MHYECLYTMKRFVKKYLDPNKKLKILEVGSLDVSPPEKNLIFRRYFDNPNWEFIGLDIIDGNNVDVVSKELYHYPFKDNSFDIIISGNTFEHVEDLQKIVNEIKRITKDLICIIVPNYRRFHEDPIDCWRIFPDGMKFLLNNAGLEIIECTRINGVELFDTYAVARKK